MKKQLFFFVLLLCFSGITMLAQQPRRLMVEQFTSSTCYPYCPQMNAWLNPLLEANAGKVVVVKYQMNWPGAGDPYFTLEGQTRRYYYGVNGVPTLFGNGANSGSQASIQNLINSIYGQTPDVVIEGGFLVNGNMITINGSITPSISGTGYQLHVVVNEKKTTGNVGTNGEREFHHVMMKMFPDGGGTNVTLTAGTAIPFNYTYNMSSTHVEEMDDLEVAVFVQNTSSKAVLNAAFLNDLLAPQNVTATQTAIDNLNVNITWEHPTAVAFDGYNIYRKDVKLNTSLITGTSFQDVAPEYGKIYSYTVEIVVDGTEDRKNSDDVLINVTMPEPNLSTVKQLRGKEMFMEWEVETTYPVKYLVYRDGIVQNQGNPTSETSFLNTGTTYKEYCFHIEPVFNDITGTKSNNLCVTLTEIKEPKNVTAEQVSLSLKEVLVYWDASSSNPAGYNIYRDHVLINTELVTSLSFNDVVDEFDVEYSYQIYGVATNGGESEKSGNTKITLTYTPPEEGIDDMDKDALFSLYPNPVSGTLHIHTSEPITDCQIFNLYGQIIYSSKSNVNEIVTDSWASGMYIIRITTEKGTAEKRFSKN
jgi:hypothetical protein